MKKQKVSFMVKSPKNDRVYKAEIETMPRYKQVVAKAIATSGVLKGVAVNLIIKPYKSLQEMSDGFKRCVEVNKKYAI